MQSEWGHASRAQDLRRRIGSADVFTHGAVSMDAPSEVSVPELTIVGDPLPRTRRVLGRVPFPVQVKTALVAADLVATICGMAMAAGLSARVGVTRGETGATVLTALLSVPIWPLLYAHQGLYQARRITRRADEFRGIVNSVLAGVLVLAGISVILQQEHLREWLLITAAFVTGTVTLERELARRVISEFRSRGVMTRRVVIVGRNEEATELAEALHGNRGLGYEVVGFVADVPVGPVIDLRSDPELGPYLGRTAEVLDLVRATRASGVIVATTGVDQRSANRLIRDLTREGLFVELTSSMRDIAANRISVRPLGPYPVMCVEPVAQFSWRRAAKRTFDLIVASVAIVVTAPILAAAAVAIRLTSGPGVMFHQERVGKDGVPFRLHKLRTMVPDAEERLADLKALNEASGPMFKMADDPRVTPVGRFLRATSIDELPQLFNVLKGQMSLVGPRPALPCEAAQWDETLWERLRVQPGITGMWQVSGRYTTSLETYARLDLYYVDNWSLVTDLLILARTVGVVLRRKGGA
ncbi:MAG TPA: sugar transferase [Microthrixaceae bacterium]|nr:sugar transferase [Microthrixaceae bacterium]